MCESFGCHLAQVIINIITVMIGVALGIFVFTKYFVMGFLKFCQMKMSVERVRKEEEV